MSSNASTQGHQAHRSYGQRARLGLIVPTTNTVNEAEWQQLLPAEVSLHSTRMALHSAGDGSELLPPPLRHALEQLTPARVDCIAYGCTVGSMIAPASTLPDAMSEAAGRPCTSTAEAIISALGSLGAMRIAVATPYHEGLNRQWQEFLSASGLTVTVIRGLGIGAAGAQEFHRLSELTADEVADHARRTFAEAPADALLLSCTDMPTLGLLDALEAELEVPVVSSNTATLWRSLQLTCCTDLKIPRGGRLLTGSTGIRNDNTAAGKP